MKVGWGRGRSWLHYCIALDHTANRKTYWHCCLKIDAQLYDAFMPVAWNAAVCFSKISFVDGFFSACQCKMSKPCRHIKVVGPWSHCKACRIPNIETQLYLTTCLRLSSGTSWFGVTAGSYSVLSVLEKPESLAGVDAQRANIKFWAINHLNGYWGYS